MCIEGTRSREWRGGVKWFAGEISRHGGRGLCWWWRGRGERVAKLARLEVQDDLEVFGREPGWWSNVGALLPFKQHGEPEWESCSLRWDEWSSWALLGSVVSFELAL